MSTPQTEVAVRTAMPARSVLVFELARTHVAATPVATQLQQAGFDVSISDGSGSVDELLRAPRAAILVEAGRSGTLACQLCRKIRARPDTADTVVLLVTSERSVEALEAALTAGFDDFLTPATDSESLLESLRAALALRAARALVADWEALKKQRERTLRQQLWSERLGALLVHDLKAPLNVIDLLAQGLLRHGALSEPRREAVMDIRDQTRRLVGMVVDLLDISRSREGALRASAVSVDAQELCRSLLRDFSHAARDKDVTLHALSFTSDLHADPQLLRRALANLVDNAVQHARPGGSVTVVLSPRRGHTELRVGDDGPGVPAELRESVFEPFKQAGAAAPHGRGLGLTFCKLAVAAHGGRIWLEDEPQGTVVTIALPHAGAAAMTSSERPQTAPSS